MLFLCCCWLVGSVVKGLRRSIRSTKKALLYIHILPLGIGSFQFKRSSAAAATPSDWKTKLLCTTESNNPLLMNWILLRNRIILKFVQIGFVQIFVNFKLLNGGIRCLCCCSSHHDDENDDDDGISPFKASHPRPNPDDGSCSN